MSNVHSWISMGATPRSAIRTIIHDYSKISFWLLAAVYGVPSYFYTANFYSWGLVFPFYAILLAIVGLSPFFAAVSFYVDGHILHFVSKRLKGYAPLNQVIASIVWSKDIWLPHGIITLPGHPYLWDVGQAGC